MTEALVGMVGWAKNRTGVYAILAETEETNLPSIRIVQKNNFVLTEKKGVMLWWKILL
jgi:RimJ/RimL family protein N-acetyltransferase